MAKTISKNEIAWVHLCNKNSEVEYIITSNSDCSWYYIYDKSYSKLEKAKSPLELEKKYLEILQKG